MAGSLPVCAEHGGKPMRGLIIAGDRETGEEYLARIVDGEAHGHDPPPNPIVEILRAVKYPHQHAIAHPETAAERPAIVAGALCRMAVIREPADGERALLGMSAEEALQRAIRRAIMETDNEEEREILRRHSAGETGRGRVILTFLPIDIQYLKSLKT